MPRRRCAGCGRVAPKRELVRLTVARDAAGRMLREAAVDARGTSPGRGAYLCCDAGAVPQDRCLQQALRRGGIARALRSAVTLVRTPEDAARRPGPEWPGSLSSGTP